MTACRRRSRRIRIGLWATWLAFAIASSSAEARAPSVWELSPYRVQVLPIFASDPRLTARTQSDLQKDLIDAADAALGAACQIEFVTVKPEPHAFVAGSLDALRADHVPKELLDADADKLIVLAVTRDSGAWQVSSREVDLRTRLLGPTVNRTVVQTEQLGDQAFQAMKTALVPLAKIEHVEEESVDLRMRAAALLPPDRAAIIPAVGDLYRPVLRLSDRYGKLRRTEPLEWTYLAVGAVSEDRVIGHLHSGLRSPLGRTGGGRVESLALAVRPAASSTKIELVARGKSARRLSGYEVYAYRPPAKATTLLGRTDQAGTIELPSKPHGLSMLLVKHGGEALARLPVVPGVAEILTAEIPDDSLRLEAEGFITGLQESLVDWVARRQLLSARIRARLEANEIDDAQRLVIELRQLGPSEQFVQALKAQRRKSVSDDPRVQVKLDKLFNDTQEAIKRFAGDTEIKQLESELAAAKQTK